MVKNLRKWYLSFSFQGAAYGMTSLVLSLFVVTALNGNVASSSVAMALFSLGNISGSIFVGPFLDKYPRFFRVVFISALMDSMIALIMSFVSSIGMYYMLALTFGFFLSQMSPAIITYLNKKFEEKVYRKEINIFNMFNSIGVTVGMFFGGAWLMLKIPSLGDNALKMRWVFMLTALLFGASAFFAALYLNRDPKVGKHISRKFGMNLHSLAGNVISLPHNVISPFKSSYFKPETKRYMIGLFAIFFGANMFFTPFPIFLKNVLKMPSGYIFIIYAVNSIFTNISYLFTSRLMNKFRDMSIMSTVTWTRISMLLLIAFSSLYVKIGFWTTIPAFMIIGFTWPFFYIPATIQATGLALPENKGKIMGLFNMMINLGAITASFIAGYLALKFGYISSFAIGAIFLLVGDRILHKIAVNHPIRKEFLSQNKKRLSGIIKSRKRVKWGSSGSLNLKQKSRNSSLDQ